MALILAAAAVSLCGCGTYRITAGLPDEVYARVGNERIGLDRLMLLLSEQKYSYENTFNSGIWKEVIYGETMEDYVKASVSDMAFNIEYIRIMADDIGVGITSNEEETVSKAAKEYYDSLDNAVDPGFTESTVKELYMDMLMAQKTFYGITSTVDTEVSIDEARIIDLQYILLSYHEADDEGRMTEISSAGKSDKMKLAERIVSLLDDGEQFTMLIKQYSDSEEYTMEIGIGEMENAFEKAAFDLESGEYSSPIETGDGIYILKCTNDNVESDYEARKAAIILSRRSTLFKQSFISYAQGVEIEYNTAIYDRINVDEIVKGNGEFYEIFEKYFGN